MPIIQGKKILLYEKGNVEETVCHKDFRLIACMNPGSDVGKKELPENIRNKFVEHYLVEIENKNDILTLIE